MTTLEKIRAEIEQEYTKFRNRSDMWNERACGLGMALEIIDKCAEQEQTNTKLMLMEANINGYAEGLKDSSKTGQWVNKEFRKEEYALMATCTKCGKARLLDEFCSNCGARMVKPQESEDKE